MKSEDVISVENLNHKKDTFFIRWNVTRLCNYECDFCLQGDKSRHIKEAVLESKKTRKIIAKKISKFIKEELNNKYKNIRVFLVGGEITILDDLNELIEILLDTQFAGEITIHITTNLSASHEKLVALKELFINRKKRKLAITCSFYKEYISQSDFIKKANIFYVNNNFKILLKKIFKKVNFKLSNIMVTVSYPLINDEDYKEYKKFKRKNLFKINLINYIIIRNYKEEISASLKEKLTKSQKGLKQIKVTLKNGKELYFYQVNQISMAMDNYVFNPSGMICDAGIDNINISNIGLVSRCPSWDKHTIICDLKSENIVLSTEKIKCGNNHCGCNQFRLLLRK